MINRHPATKQITQSNVVTSFGQADMVRVSRSGYELRGATDDETTAAKEWISLFMHEACLSRNDSARKEEFNAKTPRRKDAKSILHLSVRAAKR
jgi:hypothetical protein